MRLILNCVAVMLMAATAHAAVAYRVLSADVAGPNLLKDDAWRPISPGQAANVGLICDNGSDDKAVAGFVQNVVLNQSQALPLYAQALSKASGVSGAKDADYSLYLDLTYTDGQPLWGQSSAFRTGTHDWQKASVNVLPAKPVREVRVYLLFRRHAGRAEFAKVRLSQARDDARISRLDSVAVAGKGPPRASFLVRDVAAGSDWETFEDGNALGLKLESRAQRQDQTELIDATLTDTSGRDRAITLLYALPVSGQRLRWLAGPRKEVLAEPGREYIDATTFSAGANGRLSRYPLAAVAADDIGAAISINPAAPAFYRVGLSGNSLLYIAFDVGLTKEKPSAHLSLSTFTFDPAQGFGGAVAALYRAYPESFRCRTPHQGIWMPFDAISKVQGFEDFGFMFKEGNSQTQWDDAHGILTFRYTEPMTWWMKMPPGTPRTIPAALEQAKQMARQGDRSAMALLTSGYHDEAGEFVGRIRNEPWCDGIVWSMNSSPQIAGEVTDFRNKWNPQLRDRLYGPDRKGDLDGEYVDSSEGYVTDELDFRRGHFAAAKAPLTFSADDHRPAIFRTMIACEYVRALAQDLHPAGKLTMANATPHRTCLLAPWLDVMGTETDWNPQGHWRPMSDDELMYRRIVCGPKPYCFLMNTDFHRWSRELSEKYMKRCLAYGMFPGFFSANAATDTYFGQPALYNRDRDLFKKYIPLCKRIAEAGWRPIPHATSSDPQVYVERFGEHYLTLFNDSHERKRVKISLSTGPANSGQELVHGLPLHFAQSAFDLELDAEDVAVIELR